MNLTPVIKESFLQFGGAVLQSRALPDARDILKPSARQIFYCLYTDKFVHEKPFQKTLKAIGSAFRMYIHGDSSAEGIIMRAGQPFAMRYPLVEVEGSYGTLLASGSWAAPRYCLTGDAFVSTNKGLIKIEDIVKSEENSDNEIPTLTCRGAFGLTTTNLIFNSGLQQTYKLTLKNGIQISGTPNHPILTLNDKFEFVWKTIDELNVGDKILLNVRNNFLYGEEDDIEYAKALGCLISEGYLSVENKINIINSDLDMIMPVQNLLQKYGSKAIYHKRNQKDNCYEISTTNQALYKKLKEDNCTYDSYHKHIPNSVFRGTREYQKEFIKYLFEGDGCVSIHSNHYGTIAYSSVSEDLIRELQILLLSNFGIVSFITRQKKRKEIKLEIGGEDAYLFCKNIGFVSERKNEKAEQVIKLYEENRNKKSTGSRGWRVFPEIRNYLMNYYPEAKLIINRKDRPNECNGPLMSKDGLKILKEKLPYEVYSKIEFIYRNFVSIPIIQKENSGLQVVYSPKINESCNSFTANGIINHNTSARLSKLANYLFADIGKDVVSEWRDNYDDTEKYPMVLPSKGYYNIVNGSYGIGVGASSSIPQYNLKEVNEALIKLLWNSDISFDEIYCAPDFATGAVMLNAKEVKESHRNGTGSACKLRSVIEFDSKERCLMVTEIPYMVYTETICKQLEEIVNGEDNPGIERFNDLTGEKPLIKIYLGKKSNPDRIIKYLYKNTSLQSHYGVNFTVLENGRYPKVFTWKQLLQAHLDHERKVYIRGFEFDLKKIRARIHIIEGLLKAYDAIDEVVQTIKTSASSTAANEALRRLLRIDEIQAKAILDLKLARLSKLDINKLCNEKSDLKKEETRIESILSDDTLLKKEIEKGLREVAEKFGDARRTQILNLEETEEGEAVEKKRLSVSFTNKGGVFSNEISTLYTQKRGSVGTRLKLEKGEYIVENVVGDSTELVLLFTSNGLCRKITLGDFKIGEKNYLQLDEGEQLCAATLMAYKDYVLFATRNGMVKKTLLSNFSVGRNSTVKSLTLTKGDALISVCFLNKERIGILTKGGNFVIIKSEDVREVGRVAQGVKGITLKEGDEVVSVRAIPDSTVEILSATSNGDAKRTSITEYGVQGRATKGLKIQNGAQFGDFYPLTNESEILANGTATQLCLSISDIALSGRATQGVRLMKLKPNEKFFRFSSI